MQDACGKLAAFDIHDTKAGWPRKDFECLRHFGRLDTGRRRGQHGQAVSLYGLIQVYMTTDHPVHVRDIAGAQQQVLRHCAGNNIEPGQTQGPGMVMQKHDGGLTALSAARSACNHASWGDRGSPRAGQADVCQARQSDSPGDRSCNGGGCLRSAQGLHDLVEGLPMVMVPRRRMGGSTAKGG